ncbi:MAG TPA: ABC transporter permease [Pyrinomonadaceae bacterium]
MGTLWQDLRFGIRILLKKPGFTAVAVLTLALGIGANTAIFSVVNRVLLRPLPFTQPEQLVRVTADIQKTNSTDVGLSGLELFDYRDRAGMFEQISGVYPINANITEIDQPERVEALLVDVNYFSLLGVEAQLGRTFQQEDYQPGIAEVAVISDGLWRRRYGAGTDVIGKKFRLDEDLYVIAGVAPASFRHPGRTLQTDVEVWVPAGWVGPPFNNPPRGAYFLAGAIGRLKPGVTLPAAQARLAELAGELRREYPNDYPEGGGWTPRLVGLQDDLVGNVRPALLLLLGAVGLVLLIACANVANLLLLRASARQREIAIRRALGAGRIRLIRQLMTESVLLAVAGGALGLLIAVWGVETLVKFSPANISRLGEIGVDASVLVFTLAVSLVTGVVFGLVPAIQASRPNLQESLKDAARGATAGAARNRMRSVLVISEFALALMLLISAALLIRSFWMLQSVNPGFRAENVLTARLWLPAPNDRKTGPYFTHQSRVQMYKEALQRLAALPGVERVGGVSSLPLDGGRPTAPFTVEGRPPESANVNTVGFHYASPGYFDAMGIPLLKGRGFAEQEDEKAPGVVLISRTMAERFFPGEEPLGKRVRLGGHNSKAPWLTVVGIVGDVKSERLDAENQPQMYTSLLQNSNLFMAFVIRTANNPAALSEAVRSEIRAVDPDLPVHGVRTMEEVMSATVAQQRFAMTLLGVFAVIALLLAAVGIYGVMSYAVAERTHEIGIRMALGAQAGDIVRMVVRQGMILAVVGVVAGAAAALLLTRVMSSMLYGVSASDPVTFAAISLALAAVAFLACYLPARRAAKVDPMVALRYE